MGLLDLLSSSLVYHSILCSLGQSTTYLQWLAQVITLVGILNELCNCISLLAEALEDLFPLFGHVDDEDEIVDGDEKQLMDVSMSMSMEQHTINSQVSYSAPRPPVVHRRHEGCGMKIIPFSGTVVD